MLFGKNISPASYYLFYTAQQPILYHLQPMFSS